VRAADVAALDPAHPERYRGVDKRVTYSGRHLPRLSPLRRASHHATARLRYGLSYTTFAYSNLRSRTAGDAHEVSFTVRNTGQRRGADVPQVYLGRPAQPPVPMAPQTLVGFERVELDPGESRRCAFASSRGSCRTGRPTTIAGLLRRAGGRSTSEHRRAISN
jgi:beta-glucosidase